MAFSWSGWFWLDWNRRNCVRSEFVLPRRRIAKSWRSILLLQRLVQRVEDNLGRQVAFRQNDGRFWGVFRIHQHQRNAAPPEFFQLLGDGLIVLGIIRDQRRRVHLA